MKKRIVVFSGAGVSAESGLGTFRDSNGFWEQYNIEDVATPEAWIKNPKLVTEFYNWRRKQCFAAQPNAAHLAIAKLETSYDVEVITQNVDNLHERAGSTKVTHLHGELDKVKSSGPNAEKQYFLQEHWEVKIGDTCPEGYQLRPHVVWFEEAVPMLDIAADIMATADIVIVVGTSLQVYPAAGLIHYAPPTADFYLIDPKNVNVPNNFEIIPQNASKGMPMLVDKLIKKHRLMNT